jgi:hypothetical protein
MNFIEESLFRGWLAKSGVVQSPLREGTDCVSFAGTQEFDCFWFPSFVPSELPGFVATALEAASPRGPYYLLRRGGGNWQDGVSSATLSNQIIDDVLGMYGVSPGISGAIHFAESEWKQLISIAVVFYVHGWSVGEEVYIFGEERDVILRPSHHGELYGSFRSAERMEQFRLAMLAKGYDLPVKSPNGSFKGPPWLIGRARRGTL